MKRHNIEFLWAWFDALRRRDTEAMAAALAPDVVWQGVQEGLVCDGPAEVVETFVSAYDANQEIDSLELQDHPHRGLPAKRRGARRGRPHLDPPTCSTASRPV